MLTPATLEPRGGETASRAASGSPFSKRPAREGRRLLLASFASPAVPALQGRVASLQAMQNRGTRARRSPRWTAPWPGATEAGFAADRNRA